jgi:cysteine desulfurase
VPAIPDRIYLDHAATTPLRPEAKAAMEEGFRIWANPSSPHAEGRRARAALEDARERVKRALGWNGEVIFTSGASEALWIALNRAKVERRIVSAVEHDAVFRAAPGAEVAVLDSDHNRVDLPRLCEQLSDGGPAIVAIQSVNSETGKFILGDELLSVETGIPHQVGKAGGLLLSDCSQSAGKYALPLADMVVVSAHKLGGPIGIGALLVKDLSVLQPVGGHERGYRQGTENLPGAMGFAAAVEVDDFFDWPFRAPLDPFLSTEYAKGNWFGTGPVASHIVALMHPSMSANALLVRLDGLGFAVSAGSACSSGTLKKSRVLDAFGLTEDEASRTIRLSFGWSTTAEEVERFAEAWRSLS